jgi:hypothetical protein
VIVGSRETNCDGNKFTGHIPFNLKCVQQHPIAFGYIILVFATVNLTMYRDACHAPCCASWM